MTIDIRSAAAFTAAACLTAATAFAQSAQTTRPAASRAEPAAVSSSTVPRSDSSSAMPGGGARAPMVDADQYKIGPEDQLEISVWKNPDLSRTVVVRPDGKISLPLLNDLQATGLTPLQLRDALTKGYAAFQPEPEVAVIVREIHSIKVSVVGGVKTPGRYELKSQATVLEALALAGGFTDFSKRDQIFVLRRGPKTQIKLPFNYNRAASITGEEENFFLMPGDIIVVPN